jgi:dephospho-CoA kinase
VFRLGLTGSIATGKSFVLKTFEDLGTPVYSADAAVHDLYGDEAVAPVEALFPGVAPDGQIDRAELSRRLLADPRRLAALEEVVHPMVHEKMRQFLARAQMAGAALVVLEIPLLFETGAEYPFDAVVVTACAPEEQRRRALRRPGMTVEKLEAILARQMPQEEKKKRADFVIDTTGTFEHTRAQVVHVVDTIRAGLTKGDT